MVGIPKSEILWETIKTGKETYFVTSKEDRVYYFLYKKSGSKAEKLGRAKSPAELKDKFLTQTKEFLKNY